MIESSASKGRSFKQLKALSKKRTLFENKDNERLLEDVKMSSEIKIVKKDIELVEGCSGLTGGESGSVASLVEKMHSKMKFEERFPKECRDKILPSEY